jgi:hypothetical protein
LFCSTRKPVPVFTKMPALNHACCPSRVKLLRRAEKRFTPLGENTVGKIAEQHVLGQEWPVFVHRGGPDAVIQASEGAGAGSGQVRAGAVCNPRVYGQEKTSVATAFHTGTLHPRCKYRRFAGRGHPARRWR